MLKRMFKISGHERWGLAHQSNPIMLVQQLKCPARCESPVIGDWPVVVQRAMRDPSEEDPAVLAAGNGA